MDQQVALRPERLQRALIPAGLVGAAAAVSATAHLVAAASGPSGAMAWWMAAMGIACLACTTPMRAGRICSGRAAGHLLAMSAAMVLIHLVLLVAPGAGSHHGAAAEVAHNGRIPYESAGHDGAMPALIGVELLCLLAASTALRLTRRGEGRSLRPPGPVQPPSTVGAADPAAVVH
ncbi:hypothetical protein [Arthrobacter sp. ZGTC412]|uniref:hypothetical protein n=1 Tax=Arthrobacter sp. ZGTC412 TaxID=2058900 RepID=UPI000CE4EC12|nr:hypothetical protein [Arthrobacter sp. ZGTC412]